MIFDLNNVDNLNRFNVQFTENEVHLPSLMNSFQFEKSYTSSSKEVKAWVNINKGANFATIGYQRNNAGFITFVAISEAVNLLNNI